MGVVQLKVYEKGQVVLPALFRKRLGLKAGGKLRAFEEGGIVYLFPKKSRHSLDAAAGFLPQKPSLSRELLKKRKKEFRS